VPFPFPLNKQDNQPAIRRQNYTYGCVMPPQGTTLHFFFFFSSVDSRYSRSLRWGVVNCLGFRLTTLLRTLLVHLRQLGLTWFAGVTRRSVELALCACYTGFRPALLRNGPWKLVQSCHRTAERCTDGTIVKEVPVRFGRPDRGSVDSLALLRDTLEVRSSPSVSSP